MIRLVTVVLAAGLWAAAPAPAASPTFGDAFWSHWGDGRAEVATYDLEFPRYGEVRTGTAVAIFVTETFSDEARVKADPGRHPASDEFPVMKLNLAQDFPTGLYDYQLMTSAFWGLTERDGRAPGWPAKVTFSSQEWCGHVFHELLPRGDLIRSISHSYFDGEGDQDTRLEWPRDSLLEDGLFLWARGFATPGLEPGEARTAPLLRGAEIVRMRHRPLAWETATLSRAAQPTTVEVPAGTFRVETREVRIDGEIPRRWTIHVEAESPHRIVQWTRSDGYRGQLVAVERLPYWQMNDAKSEAQLSRIGLSRRPARTP